MLTRDTFVISPILRLIMAASGSRLGFFLYLMMWSGQVATAVFACGEGVTRPTPHAAGF